LLSCCCNLIRSPKLILPSQILHTVALVARFSVQSRSMFESTPKTKFQPRGIHPMMCPPSFFRSASTTPEDDRGSGSLVPLDRKLLLLDLLNLSIRAWLCRLVYFVFVLRHPMSCTTAVLRLVSSFKSRLSSSLIPYRDPEKVIGRSVGSEVVSKTDAGRAARQDLQFNLRSLHHPTPRLRLPRRFRSPLRPTLGLVFPSFNLTETRLLTRRLEASK